MSNRQRAPNAWNRSGSHPIKAATSRKSDRSRDNGNQVLVNAYRPVKEEESEVHPFVFNSDMTELSEATHGTMNKFNAEDSRKARPVWELLFREVPNRGGLPSLSKWEKALRRSLDVTMDIETRVVDADFREGGGVAVRLSLPVLAVRNLKVLGGYKIFASHPLVHEFAVITLTWEDRIPRRASEEIEARWMAKQNKKILLKRWMGNSKQCTVIIPGPAVGMCPGTYKFQDAHGAAELVWSRKTIDAACWRCGVTGHLKNKCEQHWKSNQIHEWTPCALHVPKVGGSPSRQLTPKSKTLTATITVETVKCKPTSPSKSIGCKMDDIKAESCAGTETKRLLVQTNEERWNPVIDGIKRETANNAAIYDAKMEDAAKQALEREQRITQANSSKSSNLYPLRAKICRLIIARVA